MNGHSSILSASGWKVWNGVSWTGLVGPMKVDRSGAATGLRILQRCSGSVLNGLQPSLIETQKQGADRGFDPHRRVSRTGFTAEREQLDVENVGEVIDVARTECVDCGIAERIADAQGLSTRQNNGSLSPVHWDADNDLIATPLDADRLGGDFSQVDSPDGGAGCVAAPPHDGETEA